MSKYIKPQPYYFLDIVKRTADLLEIIAERGEMSVAELVRALGHDRNAINRTVLTLADLGWLKRLDNKRYTLTMKMFRLSGKTLNVSPLPQLVTEQMHLLADLFGQTVCLGQRHGLHVLTIDVISSTLPVRYVSHIGNTAPLQNAAMGKCLLAAMDNKQLEQTIAQIKFIPHTANSIMDAKALLEEIKKTRRRGYGFDDEEWSEGVRCLAIPIYNQLGQAAYALSISGMASIFSGSNLRKITQKMLKVKRCLADYMGLSKLRF